MSKNNKKKNRLSRIMGEKEVKFKKNLSRILERSLTSKYIYSFLAIFMISMLSKPCVSFSQSISVNVNSPSATTINKIKMDYHYNGANELCMDFVFDMNIKGCKGQKILGTIWFYAGGDYMYHRNLVNGKKVPVEIKKEFVSSNDNSHWSDFVMSIPVSKINLPPNLTDYKFGVSFEAINGSQKVRIGYRKPEYISTITNYYYLEQSDNQNSLNFTNSNPYYHRIFYSGKIIECYKVGNNLKKGDGWYHSREIDSSSGVTDVIGVSKAETLFTGMEIAYYQKNPEAVRVKYIEERNYKYEHYMKQSEAFRYKRNAESELRKRNVTPISDQLQSKYDRAYMSRDNETTFKGEINKFKAMNELPTSKYVKPSSTNSYTPSQSPSSSSNSNVSQSSNSAIKGLTVLAAIGAAIWGVAKSIDDAEAKAYDNKQRKAAQESNRSMNNVEIVDWWTFNWLAISHAKVQLRNKNNYDVNVTVGLYQGKWSNGKIIYNGREQSDYIPGVSDDYSTTIRVKANSIRTVYLKADSRGRPTNIRISSVR